MASYVGKTSEKEDRIYGILIEECRKGTPRLRVRDAGKLVRQQYGLKIGEKELAAIVNRVRAQFIEESTDYHTIPAGRKYTLCGRSRYDMGVVSRTFADFNRLYFRVLAETGDDGCETERTMPRLKQLHCPECVRIMFNG